MAKENKEVTERMREDIDEESAAVEQIKERIIYLSTIELAAFNGGREVSLAVVDIKESEGRLKELLDDLFHPVTKELNNRLEDL